MPEPPALGMGVWNPLEIIWEKIYHADLVNRNFRKFRGVIPSSHFAIRLSHFSVWLFPILTNSIPVKNSFRFGKEAEKTQKIPEKT